VAISVLVVTLAYSSISAFNVFAVQRGEAPPNADCDENPISDTAQCCWTETDPNDPEGIELNWCQSCSTNGCNPKFPAPVGPRPPPSGPVAPLQGGVLEQTPTPPPSGPAAPLQEGEVLQQPPSQGVAPPLTRGQGVLPEDGVLQQPPADDGTAPRTVEPPVEDEATQPPEPLTDCPEGQILDEETGLCVLEEPEPAEEAEEQSTEEETDNSDNSDN
jgi:hypothetical protein